MSATKKVVDGETSGSQRIRIILTTSKSVANLEKVGRIGVDVIMPTKSKCTMCLLAEICF